MLARLPRLIDPVLLADRRAILEGELPIKDLVRLADKLAENSGNVLLKLEFSRAGKLAKIEGQVSARLLLKCQRCLEAVEWLIDNRIKLGIVCTPQQADSLPDDFEPFMVGSDDRIALATIIEDELLLNIPDIPKHDRGCRLPLNTDNGTEQQNATAKTASENPFAILADLKLREKNHGSTKK